MGSAAGFRRQLPFRARLDETSCGKFLKASDRRARYPKQLAAHGNGCKGKGSSDSEDSREGRSKRCKDVGGNGAHIGRKGLAGGLGGLLGRLEGALKRRLGCLWLKV